jgi:hypothetical protein
MKGGLLGGISGGLKFCEGVIKDEGLRVELKEEEETGAALSMKQANRKCVGFLRRNFTRESINQPLYCCCFDLLR